MELSHDIHWELGKMFIALILKKKLVHITTLKFNDIYNLL